jgi:iron complex outermembrane receptor protein
MRKDHSERGRPFVGSATYTATCALGSLALLAAPGLAAAQDLTALSLEDLLAQEVTSTAKRQQSVKNAPAAVFVISREDIRRSGATTLPDLLRMVPGAEVADLSPGRSAVSVRGFNSAMANKLLVLVDGRAVYNSVLPGVPWDQQMVPVETIERIEVVRGPGAALWGANAVNGVINVVTKHAVDSLGGLATVRGDTADSGRAFIRQGFRIGEHGALRVYGVAREHRADTTFFGESMRDRAQAWQAGFRFDLEPSEKDAITLQGDFQRGRYSPVPLPGAFAGLPGATGGFSGRNLLTRWARTHGSGRSSLQLYYDRTVRDETVDEHYGREVLDGEFSNQFKLGGRHDLVWGLTWRRVSQDHLHAPNSAFADPVETTYGGYVQDDVSLLPQRLVLSLGAKIEHSKATGFKAQPSVRAIWTDPRGWSVWGAISKANRTPGTREVGIRTDLRPFFMINAADVASESLVAYEAGWRGPLSDDVSLDVTVYHNHYKNLIAHRLTPPMDGSYSFDVIADNVASARAYGVEAEMDVRARSWWTVKAAASWQQIKTSPIGADTSPFGAIGDEHSPQGQLSVRSMMDLGDSVDLDAWVRHVDALGDGATKAYTQLDLRVAWRPTPGLELSVRGVNLLGHKSTEFRSDVGESLQAPSVISDRRLSLSVSARY